MLSRVVTPAGLYDDNAWMTRCWPSATRSTGCAQRDGDPRTVLVALGGADIAAATGLILGAASRRTPVMFDGPVGAAAALLANDFSPQSRAGSCCPTRAGTWRYGSPPRRYNCARGSTCASTSARAPRRWPPCRCCRPRSPWPASGEQVEPTPLTRIDSTGGQVFVGVARPIEPKHRARRVVPAQAGAPARPRATPRADGGASPASAAPEPDPQRDAAEADPGQGRRRPAKAAGAKATPPEAAPAKAPATPPLRTKRRDRPRPRRSRPIRPWRIAAVRATARSRPRPTPPPKDRPRRASGGSADDDVGSAVHRGQTGAGNARHGPAGTPGRSTAGGRRRAEDEGDAVVAARSRYAAPPAQASLTVPDGPAAVPKNTVEGREIAVEGAARGQVIRGGSGRPTPQCHPNPPIVIR